MGSNTGTVMTLANGIIGVSVLAMPFCFKQCGIVLSVIMLIASSFLSRLSCHFLLKSAQMARRRDFEYLAFHIFGQTGKFFVGLSVIGFLLGTCIAFFVVIGDLGPVIVSKTVGVNNTTTLRPSILLGLALFVVLPLGLLRNVDSLSSISTATIGFYVCLVLKVIGEALPHLSAGNWVDSVYFWKPEGILQCIPIFSMALFCQTQLFSVFAVPNASLEHMNSLIRNAVNICTCVYICVGFFGYVAFCTQNFTGNILMSFSPSIFSDAIKLGFVLSLGVSFPLVIFPCRESIYSLFFRKVQLSHHDVLNIHIPEARFKCITIFVIGLSLIVGLLIPNIELVLGLVGSTIGVMICVIFPATAFIKTSTKPTTDRFLAQVVLFVGLLILILGTYATLYAANEVTQESVVIVAKNDLASAPPNIPISQIQAAVNIKEEVLKDNVINLPDVKPKDILETNKIQNGENKEDGQNKIEQKIPEVRQEPPVPIEPGALPKLFVSPLPPEDVLRNVKVKSIDGEESKRVIKQKEENKKEIKKEGEINREDINKQSEVARRDTVEHVINQDAIKKEEEELAEAEEQDKAQAENRDKELLQTLKKHKEEQKKLLQEQKQILEELKEHQKEHQKEIDKERVGKEKQIPETQNFDKIEKSKDVKYNSPPVQNDVLPHPVDNNVNSVKNKGIDNEIQETLGKEIRDQKNMNVAVNNEKRNAAENVPAEENRVQDVDASNDLQANQPKEIVAPLSQNMIPLPVAVMNESKFSKMFSQVSEDKKNDGDKAVDDDKHFFGNNEEKRSIEVDDPKRPVENKIDVHVNKQRDILSENIQPVGNHDRQKRDVETSGTIQDGTASNLSLVAETVKDQTCLKKEKDKNDNNMENILAVEAHGGEQMPEPQNKMQMDNNNAYLEGIPIEQSNPKIDINVNTVQDPPKETVLPLSNNPTRFKDEQVLNKKPDETQENLNSQIKMVPQLSLQDVIPQQNILPVAKNDLNHMETKPLSRDLKSLDVSKSDNLNEGKVDQ